MFATAVAGCAGTGEVRYTATADVSTPALVEVQPGVQVVRDYDEPVFYSEGVYWRYNGGVWYRSPTYNRGWIRVEAPPVAIRRVDRPERYVHYRGDAEVRADQRAINRDNREIRQDSRDLTQDKEQLARDREAIDRDNARGDKAAVERDTARYQRDLREYEKNRGEYNKDTERRNEMEREKRRDEQK